MVKNMKLKILNRGKIVVNILASVLQDHENRISALEHGGGDKRNVKFNITDGSDPIDGATVTIGTISGTTGSAGGCTLQDVPDGQHSVTVTASGFNSKTETITVSETNIQFTIKLVRI